MGWAKKAIVGFVMAGLALQVGGTFAPEDYAMTVIVAGIGLVCAGAAGLAGKEAYCFGYREGWMLMWGYPVVVLAVLLGLGGGVFNALAFSALFLLILSLTGKKLRQPLLSPCTTDVCEAPAEKISQ
jgi:uncharacterized integral membrane protein